MAISKYVLGNKYDYYNIFKKWLKKVPKKTIATEALVGVAMSMEEATEAFKKTTKAMKGVTNG